jgi:hypothetical protein
MLNSWREYCIRCDEMGEFYFPGNPIPEPKMHSCGRMLVLISGLAVKNSEEAHVAKKLRKE